MGSASDPRGLMLAFEVAQSTVSKYMPHGGGLGRKAGRRYCATAQTIAAVDLCVVPTLSFDRCEPRILHQARQSQRQHSYASCGASSASQRRWARAAAAGSASLRKRTGNSASGSGRPIVGDTSTTSSPIQRAVLSVIAMPPRTAARRPLSEALDAAIR